MSIVVRLIKFNSVQLSIGSFPENEYQTDLVPEFHVALDSEQITGKSHVGLARGALQHVAAILGMPRCIDEEPDQDRGSHTCVEKR